MLEPVAAIPFGKMIEISGAQTAKICRTNTTLLDASPAQVSGRLFRYDRDVNGTLLSNAFEDLTDVYEYDFGLSRWLSDYR